MLAAGVTHTFLDVVPALALGVPDAAMAASTLPGHRLVLAGRGREALRLSALGSGLAVALALPLAVPVTAAATAVYADVAEALPAVLAATFGLLVAGERGGRRALAGAVSFLLAAGLGAVVLGAAPLPWTPLPVGGPLTPLLAGLFGAPVLLEALDGGGVPPQADAAVRFSPVRVLATALSGTGAGALVGYLPGVSAGVAATLALPVAPGRGPRTFLVAASGANTANTVFALFALAALGTPRTGVLVAVESVGAAGATVTLLAAGLVAAGCGAALVLLAGDAYLAVASRANTRRLVVGVLGLLVVLSALFAGPVGPLVLGAGTVVGLVPVRAGCRRVHLMGVLVGPLVVSAGP
jgi:putative membrane protein